MKKNETKKAKTTASKPLAKTVAKASPAKPAVKAAATKKAAPAKKATPAKKAAHSKKAPVKATVAKKAAPAKKAPVKASVAKKAAPAKKTAVKTVAKKAAPVKKAVVKVEAKKATPAKKAPVKPVSQSAAISKKKIDKNKETQASHHGRIITKAELKAFQNLAEANGHVIKKSYLSPKLKKHYREMLLKLRESYQDQLNIHRDDALTNRKSGPSAGMATHMADLGSDNFQHDFELGLLSDEGTVIEMIDEALTRLDENEYGICIECGQEISAARLEVKPYARFCLECKSRKEAHEGMHRR